jgi:hypothetical protein
MVKRKLRWVRPALITLIKDSDSESILAGCKSQAQFVGPTHGCNAYTPAVFMCFSTGSS